MMSGPLNRMKNKMTMISRVDKSCAVRRLIRWGIAFLIVGAVAVYFFESNTIYTYDVYAVEGGYGYQIRKGEKILIQQDFIPTLEGYQPFAKENHAIDAAKLMIDKLNSRQIPALSAKEIEEVIVK